MLELKSLTMRMAGRAILDDCSLQSQQGSIIALLGPSGSGKTTILRAIQGLGVPQDGTILLDGEPLTADGQIIVAPERRPFAYLFQNFTLFPHLDVKRNITIGIRHKPKAERRDLLQRFGQLLGIDHLFDRDIHALSGGEQQRVAFARTLTLSPRLLLLDEPFSNLDTMTKDRLYHDIKRLIVEQGMSAILATHDQQEAFFFADRLLVMNQGRVVADGRPQDIYQCPPNEWVARFTGEVNILSAEQIQRCFGLHLAGAGEGRWMLRPEHLQLRPAANGEGVFRVQSLSYHGTVTRYRVTDEQGGLMLHSLSLGAPLMPVGATVDLVLIGEAVRLRS